MKDEDEKVWSLYRHQVRASTVYRNCVKKLADYLSHHDHPELARIAIANLGVADETIRKMP